MTNRKPGWMWNIDQTDQNERVEFRRYSLESSNAKLHRTPDKQTMFAEGPAALLFGWTPDEPIIREDTRVVAFGSCFAARFSEWLADHGYNKSFDADSDESLVRSGLEGPATVAQQFRWAFGELESESAVWFSGERHKFEATEERRLRLRSTLLNADVLIISLGFADEWFDTQSGEPIWRAPARGIRSDRFAYRVTTTTDCLNALETIHRLRTQHMPQTKIVYTVSPQRLASTFRHMSPIVANTITKSIIRAGVDEFFRAHEAETNQIYFYFPAFEIVTQLLFDHLQPDNHHITDYHASLVLNVFARNYTTATADDVQGTWPASPLDEARAAIEALEAQRAELQTVCDERLAVIQVLDAELKRRDALAGETLAAAAPQ